MNKMIKVPIKEWYDNLVNKDTATWEDFFRYLANAINEGFNDEFFKVKYGEIRVGSSSYYPTILFPKTGKANVYSNIALGIETTRLKTDLLKSQTSCTFDRICINYYIKENEVAKTGTSFPYLTSATPTNPANNSSTIALSVTTTKNFVIQVNTDYLDKYNFYLLSLNIEPVDSSSTTYSVNKLGYTIIISALDRDNSLDKYEAAIFLPRSSSYLYMYIFKDDNYIKTDDNAEPQIHAYSGRYFSGVLEDAIPVTELRYGPFYNNNIKFLDVYNSDFLTSKFNKLSISETGMLYRILTIDGQDYDGIAGNSGAKFIIKSLN